MFWIAAFLLTITVGLLFGSIITATMISKWRGLVMVIIAIAVGFAIAGMLAMEEEVDTKNWNNGYCPTCNEHWMPNGVTKNRNGSTTRYYYCPECYTEIKQH